MKKPKALLKYNSFDRWFFQLRASNGQVLFTSSDFDTKEEAAYLREQWRHAVRMPRMVIQVDWKHEYTAKLFDHLGYCLFETEPNKIRAAVKNIADTMLDAMHHAVDDEEFYAYNLDSY